MRGIQPSHVEKYGEALVGAVKQGLAVRDHELPHVEKRKRIDPETAGAGGLLRPAPEGGGAGGAPPPPTLWAFGGPGTFPPGGGGGAPGEKPPPPSRGGPLV